MNIRVVIVILICNEARECYELKHRLMFSVCSITAKQHYLIWWEKTAI